MRSPRRRSPSCRSIVSGERSSPRCRRSCREQNERFIHFVVDRQDFTRQIKIETFFKLSKGGTTRICERIKSESLLRSCAGITEIAREASEKMFKNGGFTEPPDLITNRIFLRLLTLQGPLRSQSRPRTRPCTGTCLRSTGGRRRKHLQDIALMNTGFICSNHVDVGIGRQRPR